MDEHGDCCRFGHELAQQFQSLVRQFAGEKAHARDVATRPVKTGDEAQRNRVATGREDDGHRRGCGLGRERRDAVADNHGHWPVDQISHQGLQPVGAIF
jgi:hypothetical protein